MLQECDKMKKKLTIIIFCAALLIILFGCAEKHNTIVLSQNAAIVDFFFVDGETYLIRKEDDAYYATLENSQEAYLVLRHRQRERKCL